MPKVSNTIVYPTVGILSMYCMVTMQEEFEHVALQKLGHLFDRKLLNVMLVTA